MNPNPLPSDLIRRIHELRILGSLATELLPQWTARLKQPIWTGRKRAPRWPVGAMKVRTP